MAESSMADSEQQEVVAVEFNLSDPDQLERQLDKVNLTEEESDELLREAYKVNKQLKKMLKQKQAKTAASMRTQSADSNASQHRGFRVLPPISGKGGGAVPHSPVKAYAQGRSPTHAPGKPRTKSAKTKSTTQRPTWDDRFSFS